MKVLCFVVFIVYQSLADEKSETNLQADIAAPPDQNVAVPGPNVASVAIAPPQLIIPVPPQIVKPSKANATNFSSKLSDFNNIVAFFIPISV